MTTRTERRRVPCMVVLVLMLSWNDATRHASAFVRPLRQRQQQQQVQEDQTSRGSITGPAIHRFATPPQRHGHDDSGDDDDDTSSMVGLYVHIPYCRRRCRYCNFSIVPIGPTASTESQNAESSSSADRATQGFLDMDATYREAVLAEIQLLAKQKQQQSTKGPVRLQSLYFGGGTPSLAPLETIQAVMDALFKPLNPIDGPLFQLTKTAEVSVEMDPGTFSISKLRAFKEMGFNRISLGVQSFDDDILNTIGRFHRRHHISEAIAMIEQVFAADQRQDNNNNNRINYSIDLISGLPGLSLALWAETLETATTLTPPPSHISLYDLQIESGTVFGKQYPQSLAQDDADEDGLQYALRRTRGAKELSIITAPMTAAPALPSEDESAFMYKFAAGYLRAKGYEHYEVSSYAHVGTGPSNRSQHNQLYWAVDGQWYALGLGATSFVNGHLIARPRTLVDYVKWVNYRQQQSDKRDDHAALDRMEFLTDVVMKRLRTSDGLDLEWIQNEYGQQYVDAVLEGASLGLELGLMVLEPRREASEQYPLAESTTTKDGRKRASDGWKTLRLTDPDGFLYSNNLISNIFVTLGGSLD